MSTATTIKPLHLMGAAELAGGIASGEISVVTLADALLERIEKYDGDIKAWAYIDPVYVREEATKLAAEAAEGKFRGPLHGVPVGIKDVFDVAGMPTIANSRTTDNVPAAKDSTVARLLREAGCLIMGKTTTVEFAGMGNPPETRNPWNLEHTAGGSSSGSGAAVGARMIPFAIGTQTGGSNNRPAAYNGVTGFKPTWGRIGRTGCIAVSWSLDHPGIIAYNVADCSLVLSVLAAYDPTDPTSLTEPSPDPVALPLERPRIALVRDYFLESSLPEMTAAIEEQAKEYAANGATVEVVNLPEMFAALHAAQRLVMSPEASVVHSARYGKRSADFSPRHLNGLQAFSLVPATYYLQAQRIRRALKEQLAALFTEYDVLLMPTAPGPATFGLESTGDASLLTPWSFVGFPSASISAGMSDAGLPMGTQLVGGPLEDHKVLRVAAWAENIVGTLPPPPNFP